MIGHRAKKTATRVCLDDFHETSRRASDHRGEGWVERILVAFEKYLLDNEAAMLDCIRPLHA